MFNKTFYKLLDGVTMGSPFDPTLANSFFFCYYERRCLDECPMEFKSLLYSWYVDDNFVLFKKEENLDLFLK